MNWHSSSHRPEQQLEMYSKYIGGDTFIDYEKDESLAELITGKSIAVVGPAKNIEGKGMGSFIDSFDLVIRPGQLTHLPDNITDDYGKRTDIIFHSFNSWERKIASKNIEFLKSLSYVVGCMVCVSDCNNYEDFRNKLISEGIKFHKPSDRYILRNFRDVGTTISCGISSIIILLEYDIKSLYITGFDFYNLGEYGKVYRDDYFDTVSPDSNGYIPNTSDKTVSPHSGRFDLHDQRTQMKFLKGLSERDGRIKLDDYLQENL